MTLVRLHIISRFGIAFALPSCVQALFKAAVGHRSCSSSHDQVIALRIDIAVYTARIIVYLRWDNSKVVLLSTVLMT